MVPITNLSRRGWRGRERRRHSSAWVRRVGVGLLLASTAQPHDLFSAYVRHDVRVVAGGEHLDLTAELTFFEESAERERRRMDVDGNGRIERTEVEAYQRRVTEEVRGQVRLVLDDRPVELAPLYLPEVDLGGHNRVGPAHHRLRLSYFARTPTGLTDTQKLRVEDDLWPRYQALGSIAVGGPGGARLGGGQPAVALLATARGAETRPTETPLATRSGAGAEEANAPLPTGIFDFAARLARDYWHLWGPERRAELEALNRELREIQRELEKAPDREARRAVAERGLGPAGRLYEAVKRCPRLLRVDLRVAHPQFEPAGPVELPGDSGALLFEIFSGGEGLRFSTGASDLADRPGESSLLALEAGAEGVTYAVAGLEGVPYGRTTLAIEVQRSGRPAVRVPIEVQTPAPGRLRLTVLSDDTGRPAPAMVHLSWHTDGRSRRPSNGLEFAPQFERQGHPSGGRTANLPAPLNVQFWCVPGPVDMALAPGVWRIGVRRGVEHEAWFEDVTVRPGEVVERTVRPRRWVDQRRRGWWSGDDHVHARLVSDDDAERLLAWVKAEDIHLANVVRMGDIYRTYFEQRGFGPGYRVVDGDTVLVPGQECPRTHDQLGHTLAMNITAMVRDPAQYFLYDTVFDAVRAQGGLAGYAHVNSGLFHVHRDMSLNVPRGKVDFAEILQFNQLGTELYYDFLNLGCKLTASAGSDVPWGGTVGEVRAYAYLGGQPFSADRWFEAFGRGRTFATSGPMLELRVDRALPGDELRIQQPQVLRVRARAWGDPRRMAPVTLEVVRHGDVLRSATSTDPQHPEATLDFRTESGDGGWIAARARANDGTSAHTTPVYVVREGLRFWKFEGLDDLIAKRLASLSQIEAIVAEARQLEAEGRLGADRYRQQLARQGDALLERVAAARRLYEDLRQTAQAERSRRGSR